MIVRIPGGTPISSRQERPDIFEHLLARHALHAPVEQFLVPPFRLGNPSLFDTGFRRSIQFTDQNADQGGLVALTERPDFFLQLCQGSCDGELSVEIRTIFSVPSSPEGLKELSSRL